MEPPGALVAEIATRLEIDWQCVRQFEALDKDAISTFRAAGRRAGRVLGLKVRTMEAAVTGRSDQVAVIVVVVSGPEADRARVLERGDLLMREAWKHET